MEFHPSELFPQPEPGTFRRPLPSCRFILPPADTDPLRAGQQLWLQPRGAAVHFAKAIRRPFTVFDRALRQAATPRF